MWGGCNNRALLLVVLKLYQGCEKRNFCAMHILKGQLNESAIYLLRQQIFCEGHLILTVMCDLLPFKSIFRKEVWHKQRYHNNSFDFCFLFRFRSLRCNKSSSQMSCLSRQYSTMPLLTFETFLILAHPFSEALVIYRNQLKRSEKMQNQKIVLDIMPKCMGNLHMRRTSRQGVCICSVTFFPSSARHSMNPK